MIDDRLENWARYYRDRHIYRRCASLEGNYNAPWRQWVELADIQHSVFIDWRDAEKVERGWRVMLGTPKLLLKYTYLTKLPSFVVCRKSHIPVWRYSDELIRAKNILEKVLYIHQETIDNNQNLNRESERIQP